jgi:hypothetical protein
MTSNSIIIHLYNGDKFIYKHIEDIKPEYYESIVSLNCCDIKIGEHLPFLPNLEELYCINNEITEIPLYPKLKELTCIRNQIENLGSYPLLKHLYCSRNWLTEIGDYPNLEVLDCSRNQITKIGKCPSLIGLDCKINNLKNIEMSYYPLLNALNCCSNFITEIGDHQTITAIMCGHNQIRKLGSFPNISTLYSSSNNLTEIIDYTNIVSIDVSYNNLRALPNILEWNNLVNFTYSGNEIDYIPPNIMRRLTLLDERRRTVRTNKLAVYNDTQNVHHHGIQKSIIESIQNIISIKPEITSDNMMNEIIQNQQLNQETKNALIEYSNDSEIHSTLGITFKELLLSVWCIIRTHTERDNILEVLNNEMSDSICKCFTGRMSRLINCLNGFDERVSIKMPDSDQIGNIIILIKNKLESDNSYTIEKHRELVLKELNERGFPEDIIAVWIENIE